jgi:4-hydroxymandelate oxidase
VPDELALPPLSQDPLDDGVISVGDFEALAKPRIDVDDWHYLADGAGEQRSLAANVEAWQSPPFAPRVLTGLDGIDTTRMLLGRLHAAPLLLAPTAFQGRYHPEGEAATMRAAAETGTTYVQSSQLSTPLAELGRLARESGEGQSGWWFQVYVQQDREATKAAAIEAVAAGAEALVLTVDSPALGARDHDRRSSRPMWPDDGIGIHERVWNPFIAADTSWSDLEWLADIAGETPVLVKGVLRADEAVEVMAHGGSGVIVSNHGARNLDTVVPTATALPSIVAAIEARIPVLVDGGIRRGTDIARALCLGADAVLIGRPYVWGLATHGQAGVAHVAQILRAELAQAMAMLGAATLAELKPTLLWPPR